MDNIIDQNGIELKYIVIYDRYHIRHEDECDSPQEAYNFLNYGEEWGELSAVGIKTPEGQFFTVDEAINQFPIVTNPGDILS